jgi:hypothetical protein
MTLGRSATILVDVLGKNIGNQSGEVTFGFLHFALGLNGAKNLITRNLIVIGGVRIK